MSTKNHDEFAQTSQQFDNHPIKINGTRRYEKNKKNVASPLWFTQKIANGYGTAKHRQELTDTGSHRRKLQNVTYQPCPVSKYTAIILQCKL